MENALQVAASGMAAQQRSLEITAQNLSNLNTAGYQPLRSTFADLFGQQLAAGAPGATSLGVQSLGSVRLHTQGALQPTGDPHDLAIVGPGYFRLQRPDGSEVYTRSGHFHPDPLGRLTSAQGQLLLGQTGPLVLPTDATGLTIAADGTVTAALPDGSTPVVGRIDLADFADPDALTATSEGSLAAPPAAGLRRLAPGSDGPARLVQGSVEASGVDMAQEMTAMMQAQRLYELNSRALQAADEMWQLANNVRR